MEFQIRHQAKGRMRIHLSGSKICYDEMDILEHHITKLEGVNKVKIFKATNNVVIEYISKRETIIEALILLDLQKETLISNIPTKAGREINELYKRKLIMKCLKRLFFKTFMPVAIGKPIMVMRAFSYGLRGLRSLTSGKLKVELLDGVAVCVAAGRGDYGVAGSIMFLLEIGGILEEWTRKKSIDDLAKAMSIKTEKVWVKWKGEEILVHTEAVAENDVIVVRMGTVIPLDGVVVAGNALVNQSSLTGEPLPVQKEVDGYVYAGTFVEEGELEISVRKTSGETKYEQIITMIEDSEKLKSKAEDNATKLADRLVPCSFLGTALVYLFTRNIGKAMSVLLVDFSCALKLSMPIAVLAAMKEAAGYNISVKGGKYMEAIAEGDTIVFDKTGTLTKAEPKVADIVLYDSLNENQCLKIAACLEEHFPHSVAKAVVLEAEKRNLKHREMHSKVEYIVAHGIVSTIKDKRVLIGSHHFVIEDEKCEIPKDGEEKFKNLKEEFSHLHLAIGGKVVGTICIEDPVKKEAKEVIEKLKSLGITKVLMMTGDSQKTAMSIAKEVGIDQVYAEVLPEDKAEFVVNEKSLQRKVIMIGDGINDSPALSAADVGIAVSSGAEIAREIADIVIADGDLYELVTLKMLSDKLIKRIRRNYKFVIGFNFGLICLGVAGVLTPASSALLHNVSTIGISLESMTKLLK
ncbi:MAG: heavy metal translocating P-type ATPase [Anaerovoracaceae bacterium]